MYKKINGNCLRNVFVKNKIKYKVLTLLRAAILWDTKVDKTGIKSSDHGL